MKKMPECVRHAAPFSHRWLIVCVIALGLRREREEL